MEIKRKLVNFCKNPFSLVSYVIAVLISGCIMFYSLSHSVNEPIFSIIFIVGLTYITFMFIVLTFIDREVTEYDMMKVFIDYKDNLYLLNNNNKISYEDAVRLMYSGKVYRVYEEDGHIIIQI